VPPEEASRVSGEIFQALRDGGTVFIVHMMLERERTAPAFSALFSLNTMLTSPAGRAYNVDQVREMLNECGFSDPTCRHLAGSPYWPVKAYSPDGSVR